ncbi:UNVERIFIED_CONTAM: hypothetical protein FKN15_005962 [Acipenser sinensis]
MKVSVCPSDPKANRLFTPMCYTLGVISTWRGIEATLAAQPPVRWEQQSSDCHHADVMQCVINRGQPMNVHGGLMPYG